MYIVYAFVVPYVCTLKLYTVTGTYECCWRLPLVVGSSLVTMNTCSPTFESLFFHSPLLLSLTPFAHAEPCWRVCQWTPMWLGSTWTSPTMNWVCLEILATFPRCSQGLTACERSMCHRVVWTTSCRRWLRPSLPTQCWDMSSLGETSTPSHSELYKWWLSYIHVVLLFTIFVLCKLRKKIICVNT